MGMGGSGSREGWGAGGRVPRASHARQIPIRDALGTHPPAPQPSHDPWGQDPIAPALAPLRKPSGDITVTFLGLPEQKSQIGQLWKRLRPPFSAALQSSSEECPGDSGGTKPRRRCSAERGGCGGTRGAVSGMRVLQAPPLTPSRCRTQLGFTWTTAPYVPCCTMGSTPLVCRERIRGQGANYPYSSPVVPV